MKTFHLITVIALFDLFTVHSVLALLWCMLAALIYASALLSRPRLLSHSVAKPQLITWEEIQ